MTPSMKTLALALVVALATTISASAAKQVAPKPKVAGEDARARFLQCRADLQRRGVFNQYPRGYCRQQSGYNGPL